MFFATSLEYILLEGIWGVWAVTWLVTVPSIHILAFDTESNLLTWDSLPNDLGESQGTDLTSVGLGLSSLEVVVSLTIIIPFVCGGIC